MLRLNKDVLILILEELKEDGNSLYSCLLVNKTLCDIAVLILWKNPWKYVKKDQPLFNVIVSHLSDKSKMELYNNGIDLFTNSCERLTYNYISFCRNLCLNGLSQIIYTSHIAEPFKRMIVKDELLKLFINNNTKFTSLSLPDQLGDKIHRITGAEQCFSELEYLYCSTNTSQEILEGFSTISRSIKKLEFDVSQIHYNAGIIKLIESQRNLNYLSGNLGKKDVSFCKVLEDTLIKHANNIQYLKISWEPVTKILSYLGNLKSLEINSRHITNWDHLVNASTPNLKILRTQNIPSKILANFIKNTKGHLTEISIQFPMYDREDKYPGENNNSLIRSIYENCLKLQYLKLSINNDDIAEFEKLFINCQHLDGLILNNSTRENFNWVDLFNSLTRSAPASLYKFKFIFNGDILLSTFSSFFDNWKRNRKDSKPILLKIFYRMDFTQNHKVLFNEYKNEGIIKTFSYDPAEFGFDEFEWT
ncbi:hypothetical protein RhiirA5_428362 [Rhizophagus irregularis]|uniref:F-box domain-containing protein n=3 Tax=Rhizophagus irregularis TaxID=588596 RepID=U9V0N5_RHIID|nr:hypothetical protein GLOIN_2v1530146 [Rhizophagus irregularis DAOM 181602=DAOM 197198]EXX59780.1 hypothetical protein RirG_185920 [Rhizophagus irregularis DAOM 197198w]PKC00327.1 hypothetical protein RhiirA5_428362 [Rhizophagus irregularis]POG79106.1 hypothetical protein GLOIN_2v1530146 [Rhizophagus irregularis DAOM 181602=DAOM 197198]UZO23755.1 hypothetical protein OCT59_016086 [Rhizophagus irregularis]|eukprot:XP_025185972.1 hypothetical protein GLOIN_2v1530146 [Rhizophagus irregularis DAOM 181602=DAOM 197198]